MNKLDVFPQIFCFHDGLVTNVMKTLTSANSRIHVQEIKSASTRLDRLAVFVLVERLQKKDLICAL